MGNEQPVFRKTREEREEEETIIKILLLGPSCSGKSRFLRGNEILHKKIDQEKKKNYYLNILRERWNHSLISLAQNTDFQKSQSKEIVEFLEKREEKEKEKEKKDEKNEIVFPFVVDFASKLREKKIVDSLWRYNTIPNGMIENMGEDLSRFNKEDYCPSDNEILNFYSETNGIVEMDFENLDQKFKIVDVGGARYHRRKWVHCFDHCSIVLFFVNLGDYDLELREERRVNRMHETFHLFSELCRAEGLMKSKMVVIFDNEELFRKKIEKIPMTEFLGFQGGSYDETLSFIQSTFEQRGLMSFAKEKFSMITTTLKNPIAIQETFEKAVGTFCPRNIKGARSQLL